MAKKKTGAQGAKVTKEPAEKKLTKKEQKHLEYVAKVAFVTGLPEEELMERSDEELVFLFNRFDEFRAKITEDFPENEKVVAGLDKLSDEEIVELCKELGYEMVFVEIDDFELPASAKTGKKDTRSKEEIAHQEKLRKDLRESMEEIEALKEEAKKNTEEFSKMLVKCKEMSMKLGRDLVKMGRSASRPAQYIGGI